MRCGSKRGLTPLTKEVKRGFCIWHSELSAQLDFCQYHKGTSPYIIIFCMCQESSLSNQPYIMYPFFIYQRNLNIAVLACIGRAKKPLKCICSKHSKSQHIHLSKYLDNVLNKCFIYIFPFPHIFCENNFMIRSNTLQCILID